MLYVRRADDEHNYSICIRFLDSPDHNRRDRSHLYDCKQFGWYSDRKYCCSLVHISLRRKLKRSPRKKINIFTTSQCFGVFWSFVRFNCFIDENIRSKCVLTYVFFLHKNTEYVYYVDHSSPPSNLADIPCHTNHWRCYSQNIYCYMCWHNQVQNIHQGILKEWHLSIYLSMLCLKHTKKIQQM